MKRFNPCSPIKLAVIPVKGDVIITAVRTAPKRLHAPHPPIQKSSNPSIPPSSAPTVSLHTNVAKQGIELVFSVKPDETVRAEIKAAGFRWGFRAKCWYQKDTPEHRAWAEAFIARCSTGVPPVVSGVSPETAGERAGVRVQGGSPQDVIELETVFATEQPEVIAITALATNPPIPAFTQPSPPAALPAWRQRLRR